MYAWQFAKALYISERHGWARFVSMQNHYNLIYREEEREMIPLCIEEGIGIIPWSPLARGLLSGNRQAAAEGPTRRSHTDAYAVELYDGEKDFEIVNRVVHLAAQARGQTCANSPGLDAAETRYHRSNYRRHADEPPGRGGRSC